MSRRTTTRRQLSRRVGSAEVEQRSASAGGVPKRPPVPSPLRPQWSGGEAVYGAYVVEPRKMGVF